jgi:hypothetical protein
MGTPFRPSERIGIKAEMLFAFTTTAGTGAACDNRAIDSPENIQWLS